MTKTLTFDPISESPKNAPLEVMRVPDSAVMVTTISAPAPALETAGGGSIDTEGDRVYARRHQNRQVSLTLDVIEPDSPAATNVIKNGSAEFDETSGGVTSNNCTILWIEDFGYLSDHCFGLVSTASGNMSWRHLNDRFTAAPGDVWSASARFRADVTSRNCRVYLDWYDAGGVRIGTASAGASVASATDSWVRATVTATAPAGTVTAQIIAEVGSTGGAAESHYVDRVMATKTPAPTDEFDGDDPGCYWTGARHASTSVRPASGGPRTRRIVADIEDKIAKIARRGGTLRYRNPDGDQRTLDLLAADSYDPQFDVLWNSDRAVTLNIGLLAKPYARGAKQDRNTETESTLPVWIRDLDIDGDVPAIGSIVVETAAAAGDNFVAWSVQNENADTAAPLFLEAEAATVATVQSLAGASGGQVSRRSETKFGDLAHVGTFRVFARVKLTGTTGPGTFLMTWRRGLKAVQNGFWQVPGSAHNTFRIIDMGLVRFTGDDLSTKSISVYYEQDTVGTLGNLDWIVMVPADEGSGYAYGIGNNVIPPSGAFVVSESRAYWYDSSTLTQSEPELYEGDYLRFPVSGREQQPTRVMVLASQGRPFVEDDDHDGGAADDNIAVALTYTPRYLGFIN